MSQVAFGVATFEFQIQGPGDYTISNIHFLGGQVPGKQSVPRAELWGAIQTLCSADPDIDIDLGIDAAYVTNGVTNCTKLSAGSNGDLWSILYTILQYRTGTTNLFKVKSHLDKEGPKAIQERRINFLDLAGNYLADAVAEGMALRVQPMPQLQKSAKQSDCIGFIVAKRIAIIQADIWEKSDPSDRRYELEAIPLKEIPKQAAINASMFEQALLCGHRLEVTSRGHRCVNCLKQRGNSHYSFWAQQRCQPRPCAAQILSRFQAKVQESSRKQARHEADHKASSKAECEPAKPTPEAPTDEAACELPNTEQYAKRGGEDDTPGRYLDESQWVEVFRVKDPNHPGHKWPNFPAQSIPPVEQPVNCLSLQAKQAQVNQASGTDESANTSVTSGQTAALTTETQLVDSSSNPAASSQDALPVHGHKSRVETNHFDLEDFCMPEDDEQHHCDNYDLEPWGEEPIDCAVDYESVFRGCTSRDLSCPTRSHSKHPFPTAVPSGWTTAARLPTTVEVGRRLQGKQKAAGTPYSGIIPLGTQSEKVIRKRKIQEINASTAKALKQARITATANLNANRHLLNSKLDEHGYSGEANYNFSTTDEIHISHKLKAIREDPNGVYCHRCGSWNTGGALRSFKNECQGEIPPCKAFQFRMLELGCVPKQGRCIPKHGKRR